MGIEGEKKKQAMPQGIRRLSCGWQLSGINLSTGHKLFKQKNPSRPDYFARKTATKKKGQETLNLHNSSPQGQSCYSLL